MSALFRPFARVGLMSMQVVLISLTVWQTSTVLCHLSMRTNILEGFSVLPPSLSWRFFCDVPQLSGLRPVRSKLFANRVVPLATRRTLLFALGLSRFVHGAGSLHLNQRGHQRTWHSAYIGIWSHLVPCVPEGRPHSFQVLYVSKAPPPLLFLVLQRATLLAKLISKRFVAVLHMLQLEWEAAQGGSWLSQLVSDIQGVALWVQAVRAVGLFMSCAGKLRHIRLGGLQLSAKPFGITPLTLLNGRPCPESDPFRMAATLPAISATTLLLNAVSCLCSPQASAICPSTSFCSE